MTAAVRDLLKAFESLSPAEQQVVAVEILSRSVTEGDLTDAARDELASELFRAYDVEEGVRAEREPR